jgi:hypothetical protein
VASAIVVMQERIQIAVDMDRTGHGWPMLQATFVRPGEISQDAFDLLERVAELQGGQS